MASIIYKSSQLRHTDSNIHIEAGANIKRRIGPFR